jgi:GT2 family glycosyltransferase
MQPRSKNALPSIRVQSILYNTPLPKVARALEYLDNAARIALQRGVAKEVTVAYGDCSSNDLIAPAELDALRARFDYLKSIDYTPFGRNLGHGGGQNRLAESATSDFFLMANPDVLAAPTLLTELLLGMNGAGVAQVEARQLPIEHPKYFDSKTGKTSWGSMACSLVAVDLYRDLGGFDAETFFLYGDDVDFSWRLRLRGFQVMHRPSAVVFHDKRLTDDGCSLPSATERYYSAEVDLLLPYKYSRNDVTQRNLKRFQQSREEYLNRAANAFRLRLQSGRVPQPIDVDHRVAEFIDGGYGPSRYAPR